MYTRVLLSYHSFIDIGFYDSVTPMTRMLPSTDRLIIKKHTEEGISKLYAR